MDKAQAHQLAEMQAHEPDAACRTLHDTGFGNLADDWLASRQEFDLQHGRYHAGATELLLQAFARTRMC